MADLYNSANGWVNTLVEGAISKLAYNKTLLCTIVNNDDADIGKYQVNDGSATFFAFTENKNLKVNDVVYVLVPNGDYNEEKIILRKKERDEAETIGYTDPRTQIAAMTSNLASGAIYYNWAKTTRTKLEFTDLPVSSRDLRLQRIKRGYISFDLTSIAPGAISGEFAVRVIFNNNYTYEFPYTQMSGQVLNSDGIPLKQAFYFDLNEAIYLEDSAINSISIELNVPGKFKNSDEEVDTQIKIDNIGLLLGLPINEFTGNQAEIYFVDEQGEEIVNLTTYPQDVVKEFSSTRTENKKYQVALEILMLNKEDNTISKITHKSQLSASSYKIRWYQYDIGSVKDADDSYSEINWRYREDSANQFTSYLEVDQVAERLGSLSIRAIVLADDEPLTGGFTNTLSLKNTVTKGLDLDANSQSAFYIDFSDGSEGTWLAYKLSGGRDSVYNDLRYIVPYYLGETLYSYINNHQLGNTTLTISWSLSNAKGIIPQFGKDIQVAHPTVLLITNIEIVDNKITSIKWNERDVTGNDRELISYIDDKINENSLNIPFILYYVRTAGVQTVSANMLSHSSLCGISPIRPLKFGYKNTNGRNFSFYVTPKDDAPAIIGTEDKNEVLTIEPHLFSKDGNDITSRLGNIKWEWYQPSYDENFVLEIDESDKNGTSVNIKVRDSFNEKEHINYSVLKASTTYANQLLEAYLPIALAVRINTESAREKTYCVNNEFYYDSTSNLLFETDADEYISGGRGIALSPLDINEVSLQHPNYRLYCDLSKYKTFFIGSYNKDNNLEWKNLNGWKNLDLTNDSNKAKVEAIYGASTKSNATSPEIRLPSFSIANKDKYYRDSALKNMITTITKDSKIYVENTSLSIGNDSQSFALRTKDIKNNIWVDETVETISVVWLEPPTYYVDREDWCVELTYTIDDDEKDNKIIDIQIPIFTFRNTWPSAIVNEWDGSLTVDEKSNAIMSAMMVAGTKNEANRFSGVMLGKIQGDIESNLQQHGLYGFHEGVQSFAFKEDGTAFIGKGQNRIEINGDVGTIYGGNYEPGKAGMMINLSDGLIDSYNFSLSSETLLINSKNGEEDTIYFQIKNPYDTILFQVSQNEYFLQSACYEQLTVNQQLAYDPVYQSLKKQYETASNPHTKINLWEKMQARKLALFFNPPKLPSGFKLDLYNGIFQTKGPLMSIGGEKTTYCVKDGKPYDYDSEDARLALRIVSGAGSISEAVAYYQQYAKNQDEITEQTVYKILNLTQTGTINAKDVNLLLQKSVNYSIPKQIQNSCQISTDTIQGISILTDEKGQESNQLNYSFGTMNFIHDLYVDDDEGHVMTLQKYIEKIINN